MSLELLMDWLLRTSWQVVVLVAVVLALQFGLRRWLTPNMRYALWMLVLLRLCMPTLPESSLAIVPWSDAPSLATQVDPAAGNGVDAMTMARMGSNHSMARPPRSTSDETADVNTENTAQAQAGEATPAPTRSRPSLDSPAWSVAMGETQPTTSVWSTAADWFVGLWLIGALISFARAISGELAFRRLHAGSVRVDDPRMLRLLSDAAGSLGITATIEIHVSEHLSSPALHGVLRPRLWMPRAAMERMDDDSLRHVLLHELSHYKHRDLWTAAVLLPITALWWFHPVVRLAIARMRADQEAARDHEVLSVSSSPAPLAYARTLIALLEDGRRGPHSIPVPQAAFLIGGHDLRRRIEMITEFRRPKRVHRVLGVGLFGVVAWATLVSAGSREVETSNTEDSVAPIQEKITVERPEPAAPWVAKLNARLDQPLEADFQDIEFSQALVWFREAADVDLVVASECEEYEDQLITFRVSHTTARQVLNLMCEMSGFAQWTMHREAVYVGPAGDLSMSTSLAFYKVSPLLDLASHAYRDDWLDDIATLVMECTGVPHYSWDYEGIIMEPWNELLMVRHNEDSHVQIEAFLNRLLNRGSEPDHTPFPWEALLDEAMQKTTSLICEDEEIENVVQMLSAATGAPILISPGILEEIKDEGLTISVRLKDKSLRVILDWIEEITGATATKRNGVILLTDWPDLRLEFYDIRDLINNQPDGVDVEDTIEELVRNNIAPESWDRDPRCSIQPTNGMVLVNQTPEIQSEISNLIESLRRALKR